MFTKKVHIHFIGIGGIGMSGIAHILRHQGYRISGCDADIQKKSVTNLKQLGCDIYQNNNRKQCHDDSIDILVYSSAINKNNPEIIAAQKRGIPTISRALMLAELMRTKYSIAIAGSHGKTTTTSLISHILIESQFDPTVIIGGHLINLSNNARIGNGDFLVAEADESDRSFLHLQATLALVTNIDLEHLETYKDLDDVKETYVRFLNNLPFYGQAFVCIDDQNIQSLLPLEHIKLVKYGLSNEAAFTAQHITLNTDHSIFTVIHNDNQLGPITLRMPGKHNIQNCLGAIAVCSTIGVPFNAIAQAMSNFKGIERRFWFRGRYQGAEIFDDYAHHPKEVYHALKVARYRAQNRLTVVFQPHRYSRTHHLWNDFLNVFSNNNIDKLIITDIYAAGEKPIDGVSSQRFVETLQHMNQHLSVLYVPYDDQFNQLQHALAKQLEKDDLLLLLGAGKLTNFPKIISE